MTVHTGSHALIFVTPDHLDVMFPRFADDMDRPAPFLAAATFTVADIDMTESYLSRNGVRAHRGADGTVAVHPGDANGMIVAFEQAAG